MPLLFFKVCTDLFSEVLQKTSYKTDSEFTVSQNIFYKTQQNKMKKCFVKRLKRNVGASSPSGPQYVFVQWPAEPSARLRPAAEVAMQAGCRQEQPGSVSGITLRVDSGSSHAGVTSHIRVNKHWAPPEPPRQTPARHPAHVCLSEQLEFSSKLVLWIPESSSSIFCCRSSVTETGRRLLYLAGTGGESDLCVGKDEVLLFSRDIF